MQERFTGGRKFCFALHALKQPFAQLVLQFLDLLA